MFESTSDNQLLGLIGLFVVLAMLFAGLIVYSFGGFKRSGSKNQKRKKWETLKADLNMGADGSNQPALSPFDWTAPVEPSPVSGQPSSGLLKSGGLLKAAEQKAAPAATDAEWFPKPVAPAEEMIPAAFDLNARLNNLNGGSPGMSQSGPYQELFKVLVDPTTKQIVVEVDGERFETIKQIKERAIGQRILETVALLLKFTGGMVATTAGMKTFPVPEAKLTALPARSVSTPALADKPAVPPDVSSRRSEPVSKPQPVRSDWLTKPALPPASLNATPPEPVVSAPFSLFNRRPKTDEPPLLNFNLAAEIDTVLQRKLVDVGERTTVKIETGPGGGLRIRVGLAVFDAVDEVQPISIRQLIQMSIKEWEMR